MEGSWRTVFDQRIKLLHGPVEIVVGKLQHVKLEEFVDRGEVLSPEESAAYLRALLGDKTSDE